MRKEYRRKQLFTKLFRKSVRRLEKVFLIEDKQIGIKKLEPLEQIINAYFLAMGQSVLMTYLHYLIWLNIMFFF